MMTNYACACEDHRFHNWGERTPRVRARCPFFEGAQYSNVKGPVAFLLASRVQPLSCLDEMQITNILSFAYVPLVKDNLCKNGSWRIDEQQGVALWEESYRQSRREYKEAVRLFLLCLESVGSRVIPPPLEFNMDLRFTKLRVKTLCRGDDFPRNYSKKHPQGYHVERIGYKFFDEKPEEVAGYSSTTIQIRNGCFVIRDRHIYPEPWACSGTDIWCTACHCRPEELRIENLFARAPAVTYSEMCAGLPIYQGMHLTSAELQEHWESLEVEIPAEDGLHFEARIWCYIARDMPDDDDTYGEVYCRPPNRKTCSLTGFGCLDDIRDPRTFRMVWIPGESISIYGFNPSVLEWLDLPDSLVPSRLFDRYPRACIFNQCPRSTNVPICEFPLEPWSEEDEPALANGPACERSQGNDSNPERTEDLLPSQEVVFDTVFHDEDPAIIPEPEAILIAHNIWTGLVERMIGQTGVSGSLGSRQDSHPQGEVGGQLEMSGNGGVARDESEEMDIADSSIISAISVRRGIGEIMNEQANSSDFGDNILLLRFTRHPKSFDEALHQGPELEMIRNAAKAAGYHCRLPSGTTMFLYPHQYKFAFAFFDGLELRPYHLVLTQAFKPLVIEALGRLPSRANVRLRTEQVVAIAGERNDDHAVILYKTFFHAVPAKSSTNDVEVVESESDGARAFNPRRIARLRPWTDYHF